MHDALPSTATVIICIVAQLLGSIILQVSLLIDAVADYNLNKSGGVRLM